MFGGVCELRVVVVGVVLGEADGCFCEGWARLGGWGWDGLAFGGGHVMMFSLDAKFKEFTKAT